MTPEQHVAIQWIDQVRGQIATPKGNRFHVLKRWTHDRCCCYFPSSGQECRTDSRFGGSVCAAQQPMFEAAIEYQPHNSDLTIAVLRSCAGAMSCVGSISGFSDVWCGLFHSPAQDSNLFTEATGLLAPSARHAVAGGPVHMVTTKLVGTTRFGRPRFRETSITGRHSWGDAVASDSYARWRQTVSARLAGCAAVSSLHTLVRSHICRTFSKSCKKLQVSMPHATPKEMTL